MNLSGISLCNISMNTSPVQCMGGGARVDAVWHEMSRQKTCSLRPLRCISSRIWEPLTARGGGVRSSRMRRTIPSST
jgi:hypothetical protein